MKTVTFTYYGPEVRADVPREKIKHSLCSDWWMNKLCLLCMLKAPDRIGWIFEDGYSPVIETDGIDTSTRHWQENTFLSSPEVLKWTRQMCMSLWNLSWMSLKPIIEAAQTDLLSIKRHNVPDFMTTSHQTGISFKRRWCSNVLQLGSGSCCF